MHNFPAIVLTAVLATIMVLLHRVIPTKTYIAIWVVIFAIGLLATIFFVLINIILCREERTAEKRYRKTQKERKNKNKSRHSL